MCAICQCLQWSVDVIQRLLTFFLLAVMICVVCLGLTICIVAGIAYGYNYMLAEFMTFTRADVSVYVRRGQINERPELAKFARRRGVDYGEEADVASNSSIDYEEPEPAIGEKQPLSETLLKTVDTKHYAEKLTKYNNDETPKADVSVTQRSSVDAMNSFRIFTTPVPVHKISILPNPAIQTTVLQSGTSEIIMRNFPPVKDISADVTKKETEDYFYKMGKPEQEDQDLRPKPNREETAESFEDEVKKFADNEMRYPTRSIPMRYFDGSTVDVEDENIAYRPI